MNATLTIGCVLLVLAVTHVPLGDYLARVYGYASTDGDKPPDPAGF